MKLIELLKNRRKNVTEPGDTSLDADISAEKAIKDCVVPNTKPISKQATDMWNKLFIDEKDYAMLRSINWNEEEIKDIVELFRNLINYAVPNAETSIRVGYVGYLASYSIELFKTNKDTVGISINSFMNKLIQVLYDISIIHDLSFYDIFAEIKNTPVKSVSDGNITKEYKFRYSFGLFTSLWENSTSKCFMDRKDLNVKPIIRILTEYFEEFLENAGAQDIEALLKFSIANEGQMEVDFEKMLSESIPNNYYEESKFVNREAAITIGENLGYMLVPAYINCLNGIIFSMQEARDENNEAAIKMYEEEMYDLLLRMIAYYEYRSEDFREYFESNWEWLLQALLSNFSGCVLTIITDMLSSFYGIKRANIDTIIVEYVYDTLMDYDTGFRATLDADAWKKIYRLLSNRVVYDYIDSLNPAIISAF